ncbi:hypothetical protein IIC68_03175 [archaeon]|nr:hypothetical protein [archaeon]
MNINITRDANAVVFNDQLHIGAVHGTEGYFNPAFPGIGEGMFEGVCDELTNLFISLSRSLGIPARFVSGISYTDSDLFPERWGFHGWAEVYFPGHGWVPFDVTYGEFGFVDPGHIKFMDSVDVTETTTNYQWRGRNVEIETMDLTLKITLKEASGKITPDVKLTSKALKSVVGFGSYNIEEVEITNLKDYYVVAELVHGRTEQLELIDNSKRDILLKPLEKKFEYFVFKVNESLRERFVYTFPLSMIAHLASTETEFKASSAAQKFTLEEVNALKIEQEPEKVYSRNVNLECTAEQEIYIYENVEVRCNAANAGNVALNNLYFCHGKCELFSLGITRDKDFTFVTNFTTLGNNRVKVLVDSDSVSKSAFVEVNVLDIPAVAFSEINYPKKISYNDVYKIEMLVEKASVSSPTGIELVISRTAATFNFDNLETSRQITAELRAIDLEESLNELQISATFKDGNGRLYEETQTITIEVERLNFIQKIKKFFLRLFR